MDLTTISEQELSIDFNKSLQRYHLSFSISFWISITGMSHNMDWKMNIRNTPACSLLCKQTG